jgi:hypothetical protein
LVRELTTLVVLALALSETAGAAWVEQHIDKSKKAEKRSAETKNLRTLVIVTPSSKKFRLTRCARYYTLYQITQVRKKGSF